MLKVFLVGLLLSIGWYIGKLIINVVGETIINRLHGAKWYQKLNKKSVEGNKKTDNQTITPYKQNKMGFN